MAVDRAIVLRQQQLLDQAMQQAGNNPILAEKFSRVAMIQSGLEYMQKKQAEDVAKGGREAELAMRKGSFRQQMMGYSDKRDLAEEALAEGQKIRNIGLALNVASTLGAAALPVIHEKMKAPKEVEKTIPVRKTPEERAAFMETLNMPPGGAAASESVGPPAPPDLSTARGIDPTQAIQRGRAQQDAAANLEILERGMGGISMDAPVPSGDSLRRGAYEGIDPLSARRGARTTEGISPDVQISTDDGILDAHNEQAAKLDDALDMISDQRGEETMRMIRDILERSPQASLPSQRSDSSMDDKIWGLVNSNMGVA
tara:strand:+ start:4209 stop:5150 length:942 start_codon:yes stop_codon:yes gene_type:complete